MPWGGSTSLRHHRAHISRFGRLAVDSAARNTALSPGGLFFGFSEDHKPCLAGASASSFRRECGSETPPARVKAPVLRDRQNGSLDHSDHRSPSTPSRHASRAAVALRGSGAAHRPVRTPQSGCRSRPPPGRGPSPWHRPRRMPPVGNRVRRDQPRRRPRTETVVTRRLRPGQLHRRANRSCRPPGKRTRSRR